MVMNIAGAIAAYQQSNDGALIGGQTKTSDVSDTGGTGSFSDALSSFLGDAVKSLKESEKAAMAGALGKDNLQNVVMAVSNAELQMQTVMSLRDKVIGAYQDIIRMPI
jgi:flagellar hook-basal body complex protein FliE